MTKRLAAAIAAFAVMLLAPVMARAGVVTYYGFNYLSPTLPQDHCSPGTQGVACSGFNNWDRHRVYKNSGDWIHIAYQASNGTPYYCGGPFMGTGTFVILRTDCGAPTYNRGFCQYVDGFSSYVKCELIIF
jgi:hypothetical protein